MLFWMGVSRWSWGSWEIIVPVYIVRTVLMNSTSPLHKSILMDHCLKGARGRWNAADSITALGWSGSAFIGGVVADAYGFGSTFIVTAALQLVGLMFIIMLWPLVPGPSASPSAVAPTALDAEQGDVARPLLQGEQHARAQAADDAAVH